MKNDIGNGCRRARNGKFAAGIRAPNLEETSTLFSAGTDALTVASCDFWACTLIPQ